MSPILRLDRITHRYGRNVPVLVDFSLEVKRGEIVCLLGPSGCGKTTALRVIAGFEQVDAGEVAIGGEVVSSPARNQPPEQRHIGMVFQDAALFPHLTVAANIGFGLHRVGRGPRSDRTEELLALIGLEGYGKRYPHELSGGQQQRVALARAMAPGPALILLDEPFSNLDADLREKLGRDLRHVLKKSGSTAVLVTHDQREAFVMADRIALMNKGRILQIGTARDLYEQPADTFAARFIGEGTLIRGKIREDGRADSAFGVLMVEGDGLSPGREIDILIRPEHVAIRSDGVPGVVSDTIFRGSDTLTVLTLNDGTRLGTRIAVEGNHLLIGPADPGRRLCAWPVD
ncbi:MAG: ABC transporter ATP-binding protein [Acidobacteriota bacterium]|nr:ABC transporter ATP-binding protein [Acidobacteriota bacterium]